MPFVLDCVSTLAKNNCSLRMRLLAFRFWNSTSPGRSESERESGLECVGIYEQGNVIHIVINHIDMAYYSRLMKEGHIYIFRNIGCILATYYRPVSRDEWLALN